MKSTPPNNDTPPASFEESLAVAGADIEATLDALLAETPLAGETSRPARLMAAMRHAALGGGKRLRPFLCIESARLFDAPRERALRAGAAIELVHCYSLVHDDLPAMDDDDLRRGKPTVHKAFDEATAILAGDALLTMAFDVMADERTHPDGAVRATLLRGLAQAAGAGGMVGGQMLDLAAEGRYGEAAVDEAGIRRLQAMKTGAMIAFSVAAGAIVGGADAAASESLNAYGRAVGAAFQIADDILDREAAPEVLGKRTGKDLEKGKGTLVDLLGLQAAKAELDRLVEGSVDALAGFGAKADTLREAARFVAARRS